MMFPAPPDMLLFRLVVQFNFVVVFFTKLCHQFVKDDAMHWQHNGIGDRSSLFLLAQWMGYLSHFGL